MQQLDPTTEPAARVLFIVPRWIPPEWTAHGLPYRVIPVISALLNSGYTVDFVTEVHDGLDVETLQPALDRCNAAVVWCAELNPGAQIAGILTALRNIRHASPATPLLVGGGFLTLFPAPGLDFGDLADVVVPGAAVGSLVDALEARLGRPATPAKTKRYSAVAMRALDLSAFLRPEPLIFGNEKPSLQIPTGYGCAKHCRFCFYERTKVEILPASELVELVDAVHGKYGVEQFLFGELDFFTSSRRAIEVGRGLMARGLTNLKWFALVSIQDVLALSSGDLDALAASGCAILEMGSEVGSDEALRVIGKTFSVGDITTATKRLLKRDITPLHNIIIGHVGEAARHRKSTVKLVHHLTRLDSRVRFNFRTYQATPQTSMGEEAFRQLPPLPETIDELLDYRISTGRSMPWLDARAEEEARYLVDYVLPLAYDDALLDERESFVRRSLRRLARLRCRVGWFGLRWDESLFRRLEPVGLPGTFIP